MFNKNLSKAVSSDKTRFYISKVFYDKEVSSYVATNGYIILVEKTTDIYDTDKFFSPLTGLEDDCDFTFPQWQRVIPVDGDTITCRTFKTFTRTVKSKYSANKIAKIADDGFVDMKYLTIVLDFIGPDYILTWEGDRRAFKFITPDGRKTACVMPICDPTLPDYTENLEPLNGCKPLKATTTRAKYVYIAYEESGEVRAVFNKESDARKETKNGKVTKKVLM